jgi:hypothetical protein
MDGVGLAMEAHAPGTRNAVGDPPTAVGSVQTDHATSIRLDATNGRSDDAKEE